MTDRFYGWRGPAPEGKRFDLADTSTLKVLPEVDPRKSMPPVFDQGQLGSCTANAICAALEHDANLDGKKPGRLSRLLCYWEERRRERTLTQGDTGAYGYDGFVTAAETGLCAEKDWPYDIATYQDPPAKALRDVGHYRLEKAVHTVAHSELAIRQVLSNKQTIAFGFTVYESFDDDRLWTDGKMPIPQPGEKTVGGHEILAIGYLKKEPDYLLCRNSWGDWQLKGYFLFPWEEFLKPHITSDLRTIVRPV